MDTLRIIAMLVAVSVVVYAEETKVPEVPLGYQVALLQAQRDQAQLAAMEAPIDTLLQQANNKTAEAFNSANKFCGDAYHLNEKSLKCEPNPKPVEAKPIVPKTIEEQCKSALSYNSCMNAAIATECKDAVNFNLCTAELRRKHNLKANGDRDLRGTK